MPNWEYLRLYSTNILEIRSDPVIAVGVQVAAIWSRGTMIARWTSDDEQSIWTADEDNHAPFQTDTLDVVSLIGDHGWELCSVMPAMSTVITGDTGRGWVTPYSKILALDYLFKQPSDH